MKVNLRYLLLLVGLGAIGDYTFGSQTSHKSYAPACSTATDDFDIDWSQGNVAHLDLDGCDQDAVDVNAPTGAVEGSSYAITIETSAAGTEDLTWNAVFLFPGGTDPVTTQSETRDVVSCLYSDAVYHCSYANDLQ